MRKFASVTGRFLDFLGGTWGQGWLQGSHTPSFHCLQYEGGESKQGMKWPGVEEPGIEARQDESHWHQVIVYWCDFAFWEQQINFASIYCWLQQYVSYTAAAKHGGWVERYNTTYAVRSNEQTIRAVVHTWSDYTNYSNQIPIPQTRREERQCKWTIHNIFECMKKAFSFKYLSEHSFFCIKNSMYHTILRKFCICTYDSWCYPKKLSVTPALPIL